jgi:exodeoxyribonuclease V beta subunit
LLPVMAQHHYVLQYHLYTVALHRFLRSRLNAYDYQQHFGGVLYLFLRAVSPQNPKGSGVFFDCPPYELVAALDELFAGGEPV